MMKYCVRLCFAPVLSTERDLVAAGRPRNAVELGLLVLVVEDAFLPIRFLVPPSFV